MKNEIKLNEGQYKLLKEAYDEYNYCLEPIYVDHKDKYESRLDNLSESLGVNPSVIENTFKEHNEKHQAFYKNCGHCEQRMSYYPSNVIAVAA